MTKHIIINGDSRQMSMIGDESVHLVITSPPYWQLKDYGSIHQIGYNDTYENYINHLNLVWDECYRVLHPGCKLCINIGDQFARSIYYGRYKIIPIRTEIIKFCESIGFDYMGAIIWQKVTTMNTTGGGAVMGSFPYPRNGILKLDYEFILIFKKQGIPPKPTLQQKKSSILTKEEWNTYFSGHWNFPGTKQSKHIAMFPEELPARLIKMFSFVNETVLDPFLGSGTTSLAAKKLGRDSIGYEINPQFIPIVKEKLDIMSEKKQSTSFQFFEDNTLFDFEDKINKLPYIFKDPLKINKQKDPKIQNFGSKIDQNSLKREEYITVKEIISPERLQLKDNSIISLLGVRENKSTSHEAIQYLNQYVKGKQSYLKFDPQIPESCKKLSCYLYLKNETLVNSQLIKRGWVSVDTQTEYKYKKKFIELYANQQKIDVY